MRNQRSLEEQIASKRKVIECLECANYSELIVAIKKRELKELVDQLPPRRK